MDLSCQYLGLALPHPFVAGASPLADSLDSAKRVEDAGAAAIVMRSIFEEQIVQEALATHASTEGHADSSGEAMTYLPDPEDFVIGPDEYLEHVRRVKESLGIPVIASLNGSTPGGWLKYAKGVEQAGADAIEMNLYYVAFDGNENGSVIEERSIEMVSEIKKAVSLPLAVKLSPFYTSPVNFARGLVVAGASGLVAFNRFFEPDIDTEELEIRSHLKLSDSSELLLRLRWLAIFSGQLDTSLAITGGVHHAQDAVKAIMCGAHVVQLVSVLLKNGLERLEAIRQEMVAWMTEMEYESLSQMRGSMNIRNCPDPNAYKRTNYMHMLQTWSPQDQPPGSA